MGCKECGKPKCNGKCGCKSPKVLQINNPAEYITFHKVSIPAAMGDSTTNPPAVGKYKNVLLYYEADQTSWLYSTDGIPTLVTGDQGPQGPAGTVAVGTTTTGEPGSSAFVENVGTPENAILNFTVPQGPRVPEEEVQEDVNNKLDAMVADGTMAELVAEYILPKAKLHYIKGTSSGYIVEFPNGKNLIYDTGTSAQWSTIQSAIESLGITKFDYVIISHPHADHTGNIQNLINNFDCLDAKWYVGMKPDYENHSADMGEPESYYDNMIAGIESNGITPIVPEDLSTETVDSIYDCELKFYNTDPTIAENYYGRYAEWKLDEYKAINYNDFSLMVEIRFKDTKYLLTGDIERPVEDEYAQYMSNVDMITMPHHGSNQDANREFYFTLMPKFSLCTLPDNAAHPEDYYKGFYYCVETGSTIINNQTSEAVNGMYTFESNGSVVTCDATGGCLSDTYFNYGSVFTNIRALVKWTSQDPATITLKEMLQNLPVGYDMTITWRSVYDTVYPQVLADLQALFPKFEANNKLEIKSRNVFYEVRNYCEKYDFLCEMSSDFTVTKLGGNGELGSYNGESNLLSILDKLPFGHYTVNSYMDTAGSVLEHSLQYILDIDITNKTITTGVGRLMATVKDNADHSTATCCVSYYQTTASPKIRWRRLQ